MKQERFLVTGASGCIGSWVLRHLIDQGRSFVASDLSDNKSRPRLLISEEEMSAVQWVKLDVTNGQAVDAVVAENGITHIVHLAGLQVPFVKENPPLGASVNVVGTTNILEAARRHNVSGLSYASSAAVFGPPGKYPSGQVPDDAPRLPDTLYGVFKTANEETARVYWQDWNVGSVGLRPGVVYGVGRDQGISSDPAKAVLAVTANEPFHIRFDGLIAMQHASDAAEIFIDCARANHQGATVCNLRNDVTEVSDFVELLNGISSDSRITFQSNNPLPVPADYDDSNLRRIIGEVPHMPLQQAVEQDMTRFRALLKRNQVDLGQLAR